MLFSGAIKQVKKTDSWEVVVGGVRTAQPKSQRKTGLLPHGSISCSYLKPPTRPFRLTDSAFAKHERMAMKAFWSWFVAHQKMDLVWRWYQSRSGKYSCTNQTHTQSYPNNSPTNNPD